MNKLLLLGVGFIGLSIIVVTILAIAGVFSSKKKPTTSSSSGGSPPPITSSPPPPSDQPIDPDINCSILNDNKEVCNSHSYPNCFYCEKNNIGCLNINDYAKCYKSSQQPHHKRGNRHHNQ